MMTSPWSQVEGDDDVVMLLDISRAHLHPPLPRVVFVTIDGKVYKLVKAMYELRDAGASFDTMLLLCDELDGSVSGQIQHLCWIQESYGNHHGRRADDGCKIFLHLRQSQH